jgi:hypothetical protein
MATRIKLRRGTAVQWASADPTLSLGEFGFEYNTNRFKIGDGQNSWNNLPYNEQIITLVGDATGSGNSLIEVTVIDDSHNHTTATLPNFTEDVQDVVGAMVVDNNEQGIAVTYDDETGKLNFDVADPVITIDGDVYGQATISDLSDTTINVTIQPDSVALGTDTTGDYVQTIEGTENQVIVTGEGTESRDVVLSLPQDIHSDATPSFVGIDFDYGKVVTKTVVASLDDTPTVLDSFDVLDFNTADYTIQLKQGNKITSTRIMSIFDGDDVYLNEYSILSGSEGLVDATLSASYSLGLVTLSVTSPSAETENIIAKVFITYIKA